MILLPIDYDDDGGDAAGGCKTFYSPSSRAVVVQCAVQVHQNKFLFFLRYLGNNAMSLRRHQRHTAVAFLCRIIIFPTNNRRSFRSSSPLLVLCVETVHWIKFYLAQINFPSFQSACKEIRFPFHFGVVVLFLSEVSGLAGA